MADLIPDPVLKGLIEGLVWITILKEVPHLLGFELHGSGENFFGTLAAVLQELPRFHPMTTAVGIASLVALLLFRTLSHRVPGPLARRFHHRDLGARGAQLLATEREFLRLADVQRRHVRRRVLPAHPQERLVRLAHRRREPFGVHRGLDV